MWLSRQSRHTPTAQEEVRQTRAETTLERLSTEDDEAVQPACPGGFAWRPRVGDQLLVLKGLAFSGEDDCPVMLAPGECCLFTQNAYIHLTQEGRIVLQGNVEMNGTPLP